MTRIIRKSSRILSLTMAVLMLFGVLPAIPAAAAEEDASTEDVSAYEFKNDEVLVTTAAEFTAALRSTSISTIFLGADIELTAQVAVAKRPQGTLTINGTDPTTRNRYRYTDRSANASMRTEIALDMSGSITDTVVFKDIDLYIRNSFGCIYVNDVNSVGCTVIFDGVKADAAQLLYLARGTMILRDTEINILKTGAADSQEVADMGAVIFEGSVNVKHYSTISSGYSMFNFPLPASAGTVLIKSGAAVSLESTKNYYGCFHFYSTNKVFTLEDNATFTYKGVDRFSKGDAYGTFNSFAIGERAEVRIITPNNGTQGLSAGVLYSDEVTVKKGGSLSVFANCDSYLPLKTKKLTLENPRQVVLYNAGSSNLVQAATTLAATDIKNVRYYTTIGDSYSFSQDKYMPDRSDYKQWFFQEQGSFSVTASNWGATSASIGANTYLGDVGYSTMLGSNFTANGVRVLQIDGDCSLLPAVDSVMEGTYEITGTGVPGSLITASSPSTGTLETTVVNSEGRWFASSDSPFVRDETVSVTQEELSTFTTRVGGRAIYFSASDPVTTVVLGKGVTLLPSNNTEKTYTPDILGVEISRPPDASSFAISAVEYVIFDDPDEDIGAKNDRDFADALTDASVKSGTINDFVADNGAYTAVFPDVIQYNCAIWIRAITVINGVETTKYDSLSYRNIFTPYPIYVRAVIDGANPIDELYGYRLVLEGESCGIPYMGDGAAVYTNAGAYGFVFDEVPLELEQSIVNHWTATVGGVSAPVTLVLDGSFPGNGLCDGGNASLYTLQCTKIPNMWWDSAVVYYRISSGMEVSFDDPDDPGTKVSEGTISVPLSEESGSTVENFYLHGGRFNPPGDEDTLPVGWFVSDAFDISKINELSDFRSSDFDPKFSDINSQYLYIIYKTGQFKVEESFVDEEGNAVSVQRTNSFDKNAAADFAGAPKTVSGYVPVGYEVKYNGGTEIYDTYNFDFDDYYPVNVPTANQYTLFPDLEIGGAELAEMGAEGVVEVTFIYARDDTHSGIPDSEETAFAIHWRGYPLAGDIYTELQQSLTVHSRKGDYQLTVTNTYPQPNTAEDTHAINYQRKIWIFDQWENQASRTITMDEDLEDVVFRYGISTDGSIPDSWQYLIGEHYLLGAEDDDLTDFGTPMGINTTKTYMLKGSTFSTTPAGEITADGKTYLYVGYRLENEEGTAAIDLSGQEIFGEINSFTYAGHGETPEQVSVTVPLERYRVVYLYREKAAPVAVTWEGSTYAGNTVVIYSEELNGYIGEAVSADIHDTDIGTTWKFEGSYKGEEGRSDDESLTFTLSGSSQSGRFAFTEASTGVIVTFRYVGDDGGLNIEYTLETLVNGKPIAVNVFPLSGYKASGWVLVDSQGIIIDRGDTIDGIPTTVDPSKGSQTLTITYKSTLTSLYIRCVDAGTDEEIENQRVDDISVGNSYSARAPYVEGYMLAEGEDLLKSTVITGGINEIVFYYEKITGGTLILREAVYVDGVMQEDMGTIIECRNLDMTSGSDVDIPNLDACYFTAVSDSVKQYDGINPVTYYYKKQMMDVIIQPVDEAGEDLNAAVTLTKAARKGEMYHAVGDITIQGYTLTDSVGKYVYADPGQSTVAVPFTYSKDAQGDITIKYYYKDAQDAETVLGSHTLTAVVGSKFTAYAEIFEGFELAGSEMSSKEITVAETGNEISFRYNDIRKSVTVKSYIPDGSDGWIAGGEPELYRFVGGVADRYIVPGTMAGYVLAGYAIDDDTGSMTPVAPGTTKLNVGAVDNDTTVYLYYKTVADVVNDNTVSITVTGVVAGQGGAELYKYSKSAAIGTGEYTAVKPFTQSGYALAAVYIDGIEATESQWADGVLTFHIGEDDIDVRFEYVALGTYVTIALTDADNDSALGDFKVSAITGEPFVYYAPMADGYYYVSNTGADTDSIIGRIDSVEAGGKSILTFVYKAIESKVTLIAKEKGTDTIIGLYEVDAAGFVADGSTPNSYTVPAIATYTVDAATVNIVWDGHSSISVVAYYTKNMSDVAVYKVDQTGNAIEEAGKVSARAGETVTIEAPDVGGYVLIGRKTRTVLAGADASVTFTYREIVSGEVVVKAVSEDGTLLESYTIPVTLTGGQDTTELTVNAPGILGWVLADGQVDSLKIDPESTWEVVFKYTADTVNMTIRAEDADNESNVLAERIVTSARGAAYTAYAPHISGYVLAAGENDHLSYGAVTDSTIVTFKYTAIEEIVDEYTVRINVSGKTEANVDLYAYSNNVVRNSGEHVITANTVQNYTLVGALVNGVPQGITGTSITVSVDTEDVNIVFIYRDLAATVTISVLEEGTGEEIIPNYAVDAIEGQSFTYNAPDLTGTGKYYYLVRHESDNMESASSIGTINSVKGDGSSEIKFYYRRIDSNIIFLAKEDDSDGRIIMVQEIKPEDWTPGETYQVAVPDLRSDYYIYNGCDADAAIDAGEMDGENFVEFVYNPISATQIIELYYAKQTMNIPIIGRDTDADGEVLVENSHNNARIGEVVYINAPIISGYTLSDLSTKSVLAVEGAEVEFYYTVIANVIGSLTVKITDSSTGNTLTGAEVTIKDSDGIVIATMQTDGSGLIKLDDLAFGTYTITASYSGYQDGTVTEEISAQSSNVRIHIGLGTESSVVEPVCAVTYYANGGTGVYVMAGISSGTEYTVLSAGDAGIQRDGYTFVEWNTEADGGGMAYAPGSATTLSGDVSLYAQWRVVEPEFILDMENHYAYFIGYEDGMVRPENKLTRAETATIFFRLLTQEAYAGMWSEENPYHDVAADQWYNEAISTLTNGGISKGFPDCSFAPEAQITRAELIAVVTRLSAKTSGAGEGEMFNDISGHWAENSIRLAAELGYVFGYGDGTFRPDAPISRAEAATILNRLLNRSVESKEDMLPGMVTWPDNTEDKWYYLMIQEATNSHYYERKADGVHEIWTDLREGIAIA